MYREHWIKIFKYCRKYIWLLIFPLLRAFRSVKKLDMTWDAFQEWISGSSNDIFVLVLIIALGAIEWYFSVYRFDKNGITHEFGWIIKRKNYIPSVSITSAIGEQGIFLRPLRAMTLYLDTSSGNKFGSDMQLIISYKDYENIKNTMPIFERTKAKAPENKPKIWTIIIFSLFFSSTSAGTIYLLTFLVQGGRSFLNELTSPSMQQRMNDVSERIARRLRIIPGIVITLIIIISLMWIISFVSNIMRYWNFKIVKRNKIIKINYGMFTKRNYFLNVESINYADLCQNAIMKIPFLNFVSITASCPGYGNRSTQIPVFTPVARRSDLQKILDMTMPGVKTFKNNWMAEKRFFWQFLWQPVMSAAGVLVVCLGSYFISSVLKPFILFVMIMLLIPAFWMTVLRIIDIWINGVGIDGDKVVLRYCRWFKFHTILADKDKVVKIKITQSIFQKPAGICQMYFYFESRNPKAHKIISMPYEDAVKIKEMIFN